MLDCAVRELVEETGYRAAEWARAGILHNAIAYSDEGIEIWFARGLELGAHAVSTQASSSTSLEASVRRARQPPRRDGRITDAKTLIGLLWLGRWRAGHVAPCGGMARGRALRDR